MALNGASSGRRGGPSNMCELAAITATIAFVSVSDGVCPTPLNIVPPLYLSMEMISN